MFAPLLHNIHFFVENRMLFAHATDRLWTQLTNKYYIKTACLTIPSLRQCNLLKLSIRPYFLNKEPWNDASYPTRGNSFNDPVKNKG